MAGLEITGFVAKTLNEIRDDLNAALRAAFGNSIDLSDESVFGRMIGTFAEMLAILWELAEAINSGQDPDKAVGAALEAIAALTGTIRRAASSSTVSLTLTGTPSTVVTSGSQASTVSTGVLFETLADGTIVLESSWASTTAYVIGDRVVNDTPDRVYLCTIAGTSAGSGGPTGTGSAIVDGTITWRYLGDGTGSTDVAAQSVGTGPIVGLSGDINTIETPVGGWSSVVNILDATPGTNLEADEDLRVRREVELTDQGGGSLDAIRAALLKITGVTAVTVFMNVTSVTDPDGVPPKAVEALVQGGTDQAIFDALLANVCAGIETHGTESGTSVDSVGNAHPRKFSRPTEIDIYVDVELTKDPSEYPVDGDDQVKAAIVAFGDAQKTGKDVVASSLSAQCFKVAGVLDVTVLDIGTAPNPSSSATIVIDSRELAVFDTSRITVASSDGTP